MEDAHPPEPATEGLTSSLSDVDSDETHSTLPRYYRGRFSVRPGQPLEISDRQDYTSSFTPEQRATFDQIGRVLKTYRDAGKALLSEKYPGLSDTAPVHMRTACDCLAILCEDGIIVRYDRQVNDEPKVRVGTLEGHVQSVSATAPGISEGYVYCPFEASSFLLPPDAPRLQLFTTADGGEERTNLVDGQMGIIIPWGQVRRHKQASDRPRPFVSISNEFEFLLHGELANESVPAKPGTGQGFITRSPVKLPTGWQTFEIYPPFEAAIWQPSIAETWAECDLLAAAAQRNLREQQFLALDPRGRARKDYSKIFKMFEELLSGPELPIQSFLTEHPELVRPAYSRMWPKLPFGPRISDFVFLEMPDDYLLVEIEAPNRTLFRSDGQPHQDLIHAIDQTTDWVRYIEDNLPTVQRELGLTGISTSPRCLVVIGRSGNLTIENTRKLVTLQNANPKTKIMTYDDLLVNSRTIVENLLGPLWDAGENVEVYYVPRT